MVLSKKQRQAVECLSNCLVLACPGSGKTRVLVKKTEFILQEDPGALIMITSFTKDSAAEIRRRIVQAIGKEAARKVASGTFHSIALDQLKRAELFNGTIIGPGQMRQYIERALAECRLPDFDPDEAAAFIETAKMTPDYEPGNDTHGKIFIEYTKLCDRNNVIDFSDMLARSVRLMRAGELDPKDCNYILTDESQDMDPMQHAWCAEHIKNGAIFTVVGDDDQSIYRFRRAEGYAGMIRFQEEFGAEIIKLDTNYRSHSEILAASALVIANNTVRMEKALEAHRGKGGTVEAWCCHEPEHEAQFVINKIIEISSCNANDNPEEQSVSILPNEWAILARNNHNLTEISMALDAYGIPHNSAGKNFWSERPVCLAIGLLSSLINGKKAGYDSALHYAGMEEETLIRLHEDFGDDFNELFNITDPKKFEKYGRGTGENLFKLAKMVTMWKKSMSKDRVSIVVRGVFDWFIDNMNTNRDDKKSSNSYQREFRMMKAAKRIMGDMEGELSKRLSRVMNKPENKKEEGKGSVFLGTLHGSKGLEFTNVWLVSMDDGVIPDVKEWTPETQEEERRLFYVGMTRAMDRLFISCTKHPSSFIEETGIQLKSIFEQAEAEQAA